MPLTDFQRMVAKVLRGYRSVSTYVGGGAALNRKWSRISDDLDIFSDKRDLPGSARAEIDALRAAGFTVEELLANDATVEAIVRQYGYETKLQWMHDPETSKRFFAAITDEELGFRLHEADNAVNKVLCASRRNTAPRDAADLVTIVEEYAPLGPLVWAVCGKDDNLTPPRIIQGIRKNAFGYADVQFRTIRTSGGTITQEKVRKALNSALERASNYCNELAPADFLGCLFVDSEQKPIEATQQDIVDKRASVMPLRQFLATPELRHPS
jgi:hypothetical protein